VNNKYTLYKKKILPTFGRILPTFGRVQYVRSGDGGRGSIGRDGEAASGQGRGVGVRPASGAREASTVLGRRGVGGSVDGVGAAVEGASGGRGRGGEVARVEEVARPSRARRTSTAAAGRGVEVGQPAGVVSLCVAPSGP
jgi:hypothetical protein